MNDIYITYLMMLYMLRRRFSTYNLAQNTFNASNNSQNAKQFQMKGEVMKTLIELHTHYFFFTQVCYLSVQFMFFIHSEYCNILIKQFSARRTLDPWTGPGSSVHQSSLRDYWFMSSYLSPVQVFHKQLIDRPWYDIGYKICMDRGKRSSVEYIINMVDLCMFVSITYVSVP